MAKIDAFFKLMAEQGASDLHLISGSKPIIRLFGKLVQIKYDALSHEQCQTLIYEILNPEQIKEFEKRKDLDFSYEGIFLQTKVLSAISR